MSWVVRHRIGWRVLASLLITLAVAGTQPGVAAATTAKPVKQKVTWSFATISCETTALPEHGWPGWGPCSVKVKIGPARPQRTVVLEFWDQAVQGWVRNAAVKTNRYGYASLRVDGAVCNGWCGPGVGYYRLRLPAVPGQGQYISRRLNIRFAAPELPPLPPATPTPTPAPTTQPAPGPTPAATTPAPTPTPTAPTPAPPPTPPAPVVSGPLGSLTNPIPVGQSAAIDGYRVAVTSAVRGAEALLDIWSPEYPGRRFLLVTTSWTRTAAGTGSPFWDLSQAVIGSDNLVYRRPLGSAPLSNWIGDLELAAGGTGLAADDYALPAAAMRGRLLYKVYNILAEKDVYFALPESSPLDTL